MDLEVVDKLREDGLWTRRMNQSMVPEPECLLERELNLKPVSRKTGCKERRCRDNLTRRPETGCLRVGVFR